jgi:chromosome segregation ATPase
MAKARVKAARDKLAKAQQKLADLEEALAVVQTEGEERVRLARERADKRIAKARKRVDKQAHAVAEREARLHALTGPRTAQGEVTSPQAAADVLETVVAESSADNGATARVPGDGGEMPLITPPDIEEKPGDYRTGPQE